MSCFKPLTAYRLDDGSISFNPKDRAAGHTMELPCGQCKHCRISRSRMWAVRCMHEASLHEQNCFLTLTYDPEHLPSDGSLNYKSFQNFMKRLRKRFRNQNIRFYMCGEYGDKNLRPHYHAIIFGMDFPDKEPIAKSHAGHVYYRSDILQSLWPFGLASIGAVTEQSAGYVARYVMKKITGKLDWINPKTGKPYGDVYKRLDPNTGEIFTVVPEFTRMSLKPGIAQGWFDKFYTDVYPNDAIVSEGGRRMKPPRYYDNKYDAIEPYQFEAVKQARIMAALKNCEENTPERLAVKAEILEQKLLKLERNL